MVEARKVGSKLKALYVVGSNPVGRLSIDPLPSRRALSSSKICSDRDSSDRRRSAARRECLRKIRHLHQYLRRFAIVKKAGEVNGHEIDFEMIVRIADAMGFDVRQLVPFGGGTRADMGQSRGAQSGEADRHAVWLEARGLEPKMSPFDPMAILDEIQRLVPGYDVSRMNLLAGNSQHTRSSRPDRARRTAPN
jgi:NADH-quinone oxidoreductase subunit G